MTVSFQHARVAMLFLFLSGFVWPGPAMSGPGHDHDHGSEVFSQSKGPVHPRLVSETELFELVGILKEHKLTLYLDRRQDTSPVRDAKVTLTVNGQRLVATAQDDETYLAEHEVFDKHEMLDVVVEVEREEASDLLVGVLDARLADAGGGEHSPFDHDHAVHHQNDNGFGFTADNFEDWRGWVTMRTLTGFLIGCGLGFLAALLLRWRAVPAAMSILALTLLALVPTPADAGPGHDDHGGHGHDDGVNAPAGYEAPGRMTDGRIFIPKPTQRLLQIRTARIVPSTAKRQERLIGRVIPDPDRNGLVQSTVRGRLVPGADGLPVLGQVVKAGDVLALVEPAFEPIDASDVRQTAGDLEQRIAVLEAQLERRRQLVRKNVASRATLQDLEIEIAGLQARRRQLEESRNRPEKLVSPVSGVVADVRVVSGQVVERADTLFHIVDPGRLWVEALAFSSDLDTPENATALTERERALQLSFVGRSRTLQQQATVLHFRIDQTPSSLSIGAPLSVLVDTGVEETGLILPKDAVAEAPNGQSVAYVREEPEIYRAVPVRTESLDGQRLLVVAGLKEGDQVIVRGASLVSQIR